MVSETTPDPVTLVELAAEIAPAYVRNNSVQPGDMPALLQSVHGALAGLGAPEVSLAASEKLKPPVPTRKTVTDEHIVSLEDGRPYKTLRKHLAKRGLTPEAYRAKWGLPADDPTVAPSYSDARSSLAKGSGLGSKGRRGGQPDGEAERSWAAANPSSRPTSAPASAPSASPRR